MDRAVLTCFFLIQPQINRLVCGNNLINPVIIQIPVLWIMPVELPHILYGRRFIGRKQMVIRVAEYSLL